MKHRNISGNLGGVGVTDRWSDATVTNPFYTRNYLGDTSGTSQNFYSLSMDLSRSVKTGNENRPFSIKMLPLISY